MGLSSSKSKTKTSQKTTETGSTTPTNPPFVTDAMQDFTGRIREFGNMDPNSFVAGASPLQQMAWGNAGSLDDWQGQSLLASQMAQRAGNAGPNLAFGKPGHAGSMLPAGGGKPTHAGSMLAPKSPGNDNGVSTDSAPQIGQASRVSAAGYGAPQLGEASTYAAARTGAPIQAKSASLLDGLGNYQNPYTQQVASAAMSDFDESAGRLRAQQAADAARTGAFGGSRSAILAAQTEGELARARNSQLAGILDQGFRTAAGLSQSDTANRQQASLFNASAGNEFLQNQAARDDSASRYGADARNQFALQNAGFRENAGQFNAGLQQQAGLANQGAQNQFAVAQAGLNENAGQFNATAQNQAAMFDAGQRDNALARQLQASGQLGALASDYAGNVRGDLSLMSQMGDQQRMIEQLQLMAPAAQLELMGQLYGQNQFNLFNGQNITANRTSSGTSTTSSSPSLFNQMLAAGQVAASFSDRRLKRDINWQGRERSGLDLYTYKYLWDADSAPPRLGVMADEVEAIAPGAVVEVVGFKAVDYAALGGLR